MKQEYGATYVAAEDHTWVITHVFPVRWDWDGYRFHGYCRPERQDIVDAGYDPDADDKSGE